MIPSCNTRTEQEMQNRVPDKIHGIYTYDLAKIMHIFDYLATFTNYIQSKYVCNLRVSVCIHRCICVRIQMHMFIKIITYLADKTNHETGYISKKNTLI